MDYYFFRTVIFENLRRMKNIDRNHPKIEVLLFTERTQYTILNIVVGQLVELPYGGLMFVTFVYGIHILFFGTHSITRTQACATV